MKTGVALMSLAFAGSAGAWTAVGPAAIPTSGVAVKLCDGLGAASGDCKLTSNASFGDPSFGGQAWAHTGRWAVFNAKKGKKVTITIEAWTDANLSAYVDGYHPAVSVWKRPIGSITNPSTGVSTPLTDAKYVPDHFFSPTQSYLETGQTQNHVQASSTSATPNLPALAAATFGTSNKTLVRPGNTAAGVSVTAANQVFLEDDVTLIGFPRMIFAGAAWDADGVNAFVNPINVWPGLQIKKDKKSAKVVMTFIPDETAQYELFAGGYNPNLATTAAAVLTATLKGI